MLVITNWANWIVGLAGIYAGLGVLFAVPFVLRGVQRIDPIAREGTWGFRVAILPGAVAFWPMLLLRWLRRTPPPRERNAHRDAAGRSRSGVST